jgi:nucleoside-diphosphate-sugar epimerase
MKILVTGSKGFIGTQLVPYLISLNNNVIGLDQYILSEDNYIRADISILSELINIFKNNTFDLVIHLASECGIENCEEHIQKSMQTNLIGSYNIIALCKEYNIRLIYFSTSEIYGDSLGDNKMIEDINANLLQPKNHYAMQKLFGEKMVVKELKNYIIVRPFMIYGAGENQNNYRSVISKFIKLSINNKKLPVHKNSYRSWLHINDFIFALNLLIEKNVIGTYNIGNGNEILPIDNIAKIIIDKIGGGVIEYVDIPITRTAYKIGDFTKLKNLGFNPSIKIENGINEMIENSK